MLADFLSMESSVIVTMHVRSIDQTEAIKMVKRKITDLDKSKIDEQKKAVRAGYDIDIIPSDLQTYGAEAKKLLQDLQSHNERMFLLTFLVMNTADTKRQLDINRMQAQGIAQQYNCTLVPLDYRQEQALVSSLPLGLNQIEIQRGLTTSSTAIFVPFTTQELFQTYGEPLYYGLNALSHNIIMVDRKLLKNPNGLILGTPGSGKSFTAKREIINLFLITKDGRYLSPEQQAEMEAFIDYALEKSPYLRYDYFTGTFKTDVYRKLGNKHMNEELAAFREAKADPDKLVQLFQRYFPASEVHRPCNRTEQAREYLNAYLDEHPENRFSLQELTELVDHLAEILNYPIGDDGVKPNRILHQFGYHADRCSHKKENLGYQNFKIVVLE